MSDHSNLALLERADHALQGRAWPVHVRLILALLPDLFAHARRAREEAVSWREFKMGAAGLAVPEKRPWSRLWDEEYLRSGEIVADWNVKPTRSVQTICAETRMMARARERGLVFFPVFAVCGVPEDDPVTGPLMDRLTGSRAVTVPLCDPCLHRLEEGDQTSQDTIIVRFTPCGTKIEIQSRRTLLGA